MYNYLSVASGRTLLWGLEPFHFIPTSLSMKPVCEVQSLHKMMLNVIPSLTLADSSGYSNEDIYRLQSEFIHHSFPSQYMSYPAFESWTKAVGALDASQTFSYFIAMAETNGDLLTFSDFLLGLIVGDRQANIGNNPKLFKLRQMYIMTRYLKLRNVLELALDDTKHLVNDLLRFGPIQINGQQITNADEVIANIDRNLNIGTPFKLTWVNFSAAIEQSMVSEYVLRSLSNRMYTCSFLELRICSVFSELSLDVLTMESYSTI